MKKIRVFWLARNLGKNLDLIKAIRKYSFLLEKGAYNKNFFLNLAYIPIEQNIGFLEKLYPGEHFRKQKKRQRVRKKENKNLGNSIITSNRSSIKIFNLEKKEVISFFRKSELFKKYIFSNRILGDFFKVPPIIKIENRKKWL